MSNTHDEIVVSYETYLAEHQNFEDKGVKAEVYIVDGDEYSKHLFTYETMF